MLADVISVLDFFLENSRSKFSLDAKLEISDNSDRLLDRFLPIAAEVFPIPLLGFVVVLVVSEGVASGGREAITSCQCSVDLRLEGAALTAHCAIDIS